MSDRWKRSPVSEIIALPLSKNVDFAPDDSQRFYYPDPSNSSRIFLIDKRDLVTVIVNVIQPLWQVMKGNLIALAIAAGNMLRYVEPAAGCGPLVNPFVAIDYGLNDEPPISGVLCALGATTENALRTVFGTVELPIDTLIGALAGWNATYICSQTDVSSPTNIATHFTNNFNEFLLSVASIIPNLFQYIDAPVVSDCITGTSDGGNGGGTATLVQDFPERKIMRLI